MVVTLDINTYGFLELFEVINPGVDGLTSLIKDNAGQGQLWDEITAIIYLLEELSLRAPKVRNKKLVE